MSSITELPDICQGEPRYDAVFPIFRVLATWCVTSSKRSYVLGFAGSPPHRNLPHPLDPGVLHGRIRIQPLGDGVADERGTFLPHELDLPPFLRDERIDAPGLAVEEGGDGALFIFWWHEKQRVVDPILTQSVSSDASGCDSELIIYVMRTKRPKQIFAVG
ncbi:MAG: hypothetical protein C5S52_00330 [ANME-2 cluster archaeon]|nr:hypothetical protein [ANME-2 cluster archaeon]